MPEIFTNNGVWDQFFMQPGGIYSDYLTESQTIISNKSCDIKALSEVRLILYLS